MSLQKYSNLDFLIPLFEPMIQDDPISRPDAPHVLRHWHTVRPTVSTLKRRWRMQPRVESGPEMIMYGAHTVMLAVIYFRAHVVATCAFVAALYYGMLR